MGKNLRLAGIAGIIVLILTIIEAFIQVFVGINIIEPPLYLHLSIYILTIFSYPCFIWGFILLADKYKYSLLKISSYISIVINFFISFITIYFLFFPETPYYLPISILLTMIFGVVCIVWGMALIALKNIFGTVAQATGIIKIIIGVGFSTFILAIFGILLFVPFYILASIILFRAAKMHEIEFAKTT